MNPAQPHQDLLNDPMSDESLMLGYARGDQSAFSELYARHRASLFRFILRQCRSHEQSEEIFQEVWMNLIRTKERYEVSARFRTYLYTLAHNRVVDYFRRQNQTPLEEMPSDYDDDLLANMPANRTDEPHVRVLSQQQGALLLHLIETLPGAQRETFLMHQEGELSLHEIAAVSGVSFETAKSRLRYALAKLRSGLQEVIA